MLSGTDIDRATKKLANARVKQITPRQANGRAIARLISAFELGFEIRDK